MIAEEAALAVRKSIVVKASPEVAFSVFTEGFSTWWPLATHHIGAVAPAAMFIEAFEGGRCFERTADGIESVWGHVQQWEPPHRLVFSWELSCDFGYDPAMATECDVRFIPEGVGATRVELEHRGMEVYGDRREEMYGIYDGEGGWTGLMERFRTATEAASGN
jgi:uncharacterized protein YndB with AHSA1/START domain